MKTRKQYLSDLEFFEKIETITSKDIKKRYRKLVLKYNVDNKNNNSDVDKYRTIIEAYEALNSNNYLDEPIAENIETTIDVESTAEIYNRGLIDFLERSAFEINLKKSDNKVVIVDNHIINFDVSKLTKKKYLLFNKEKILKFTRKL